MKTIMMCASLVSVLAAVAQAQNANITWGTPTTISVLGAPDVSIVGAYFGSWTPYAYNSPETVNGVTLGSDLPDVSSTFDNAGGTGTFNSPGTMNANYNDLLTSALFGNSGGPYTVSWDGMTAGDTYELEFWVNDARNSTTAERSEVITGGSDTSAPLFYGSDDTGPGQFILGTFVADDTGSETITINGLAGADISASAQMNMLLVRDITATPEPSTLAFFAGGLGVMFVGFRRKGRG